MCIEVVSAASNPDEFCFCTIIDHCLILLLSISGGSLSYMVVQQTGYFNDFVLFYLLVRSLCYTCDMSYENELLCEVAYIGLFPTESEISCRSSPPCLFLDCPDCPLSVSQL